MKKSLSFIIPVYNNASGIHECVKSIDCFDRNDIEIIIIDDGSTDGTGKMIDDLKVSHQNVKSFLQDHKGVVAARQLGLSVSEGEYIWFVDSDDKLCDGAVGKVLDDISTKDYPDIVVFNHYSEGNGKRVSSESKLPAGEYDRSRIEKDIFPYAFHDFRQKHFRQPIIDGFLWNKVWKKELITKALCTDSRISLFEDAISVFMAVSYATSIYKTDDFRYIYVKGESATSGYRNDYFLNTALCESFLKEELKKLPLKLSEDGKKGANAFITERLIVSIVREMRYKKGFVNIYKNVSSELKKYKTHKRLKYTDLPLLIKFYLFLLKRHFYVSALIVAKVMV